MGQVVTIGLDLAKSVFQVHGVDEAGEIVVRRKLRRSQLLAFFAKLPACLVGVEACASSHHWARELTALGHEVKLMPAQYVKPYVKRSKNDAADAEAICEAVTRPTMRFVAIKSPDQQCAMMLHRVRLVLCRQRTQLPEAQGGHLARGGNYGVVEADLGLEDLQFSGLRHGGLAARIAPRPALFGGVFGLALALAVSEPLELARHKAPSRRFSIGWTRP